MQSSHPDSDDWEPIRQEIERSWKAAQAREAAHARSLVDEFIAKAEQSGVRPARHSLPPNHRGRSAAIRGWSLSGCPGSLCGCRGACTTVVTPGGKLARMAEQPRHRVAFLRRPVFGEILEPESYDETAPKPMRALQQELAAGLSRLLRTG